MSKTKPLEYVTAALAAGQHDFGENYIQELQEKSAALADNKDVKYGPLSPRYVLHLSFTSTKPRSCRTRAASARRWHFIGTLQSNKVKHLVACPNLALVHTMPSLKTARKLDSASKELRPGNPLAVLVQVNTSGEACESADLMVTKRWPRLVNLPA